MLLFDGATRRVGQAVIWDLQIEWPQGKGLVGSNNTVCLSDVDARDCGCLLDYVWRLLNGGDHTTLKERRSLMHT